jgi:hypothetical protein
MKVGNNDHLTNLITSGNIINNIKIYTKGYNMTISKKLLLIATLGLGLNIPCITFANLNEPFFSKTNAELQHLDNIKTISNFMPVLHQQESIDANKIVQWLQKKLQKHSLNTYDSNAIANIIRTNTTTENKIVSLLQIITAKKTHKAHLAKKAASEKQKLKYKKIAETALICGAGIFLGALILIDAAINPYKFYQEPDTTTISYRYGSAGWSTTYAYKFNDNRQPTYCCTQSYPNLRISYQF